MFTSRVLLTALCGLVATFQLEHVAAFYYNQYHANAPPAPFSMFPDSSSLYPSYEQQQQAQQQSNNVDQQNNNNDNNNAYSNGLWNGQQSIQNLYQDEPQQQSQQAQQFAYPISRGMMFQDAPQPPQDICATGFVEHCLVQANNDGEQRLLASMIANRTGQLQSSEYETLTREFDGMCHVVIRFIDCLNAHYIKCSPVSKQQQLDQIANAKDMFADSWSSLCAADGQVRKKYLEHATCIKQALTENNGQEQCQARFQTYFMSGQISLDSIGNAIHYGCCAFNEWQYCIDSLIVKQCGHDAMKSVQDLIEKASGGLVSSLCDKKAFGRKSKTCMGKKGYGIGSAKLAALDPKINATLHKYIGIFGDFIDRLPDEEEQQ